MPEYISSVYALIDPRDREIKYVGVTKRPLEKRLQTHIYSAKPHFDATPKGRWIAKLLRQGYRPEIVLVQEVDSAHVYEAEVYWISYFKSVGAPLKNVAPGGNTPPGSNPRPRAVRPAPKWTRSAESRAKAVATRRANNPSWFPTGFVRVKGAAHG